MMEFCQFIFCALFYGYLTISEGIPIHDRRTSQNAIKFSLKHANVIPKVVLESRHTKRVTRQLQKKWIRPVKRIKDKDETFEGDCSKVYVAYQALIGALPKIMRQDEIESSMTIMGAEGYDINDPIQLQELSCLLVSFARNNLIETLPLEERRSFENGLAIFKVTIKYLETLLANANNEDLREMQDEVAAIRTLINFYHVLEEVGFIPPSISVE